MRAGFVAICFLAAASCSYEIDDPSVPQAQDIAELESALARHPCVGDLGLWERNYRFSRQTGLFSDYSLNPDFNVIEFHLRRAGTIRIDPDRRVVPWSKSQDWPDTNTIRSLEGRFKVDGGILEIGLCKPVVRD